MSTGHSLSRKDYVEKFRHEVAEMVRITEIKNADYADGNDAFQNFTMIEKSSNGHISTEAGILTRMSDKFQRVVNLSSRPARVNDEAITDTLRDLAVYSIILKLYLETKNENQHTAGN